MSFGEATKTHSRLWVLYILALLGFAAAAFYLHDQHRTVTRRMGWKCIGVEDTKYPQYPHVEAAAFWFKDNPRYEEQASGPTLCADLKASGVSDVEMTFDTWGNRFIGLHGYNTTRLTANGKGIVIYDSSSGGTMAIRNSGISILSKMKSDTRRSTSFQLIPSGLRTGGLIKRLCRHSYR